MGGQRTRMRGMWEGTSRIMICMCRNKSLSECKHHVPNSRLIISIGMKMRKGEITEEWDREEYLKN